MIGRLLDRLGSPSARRRALPVAPVAPAGGGAPRILVPLHAPDLGGVERVALRIAADWAAAGADVRLVVGRGRMADADRPPGVRLEFLARGRAPVAWIETLWMLLWIPVLAQRHRPDVIFCAGNTYAVVGVAARLLLGGRCPTVFLKVSNDLNRHDLPGPARWAYRRWLAVQGRWIDRFFAIGPAMVGDVVAGMGVAAARVSLVRNPVLSTADFDRLSGPGRPVAGRGRRFVAIGRLASQKDYPSMLRAFGAGASAADRLTVCGRGPELAGLRRLVATLGLGDKVSFVGQVDDVVPFLLDADVFLLSSRYEGVPAALVEALAAELPVVALDCGGAVAELLADGVGVLVPPGDDAAFANAIAGPVPPSGERGRTRAAAHVREHAAREMLRVMTVGIVPCAGSRRRARSGSGTP